MKTRSLILATALAAAAVPHADAGFHLFDIQEIYSNADGSVQFIELFTTAANQQFVSGHTITLQTLSGTSLNNVMNPAFTFSGTGPSPTDNKTYLIGTANLGTLYGVTPDFVLPTNFLQVVGGSANKRVNFASNTDIVNLGTVGVGNLPLNGSQSLDGLVNDSNPANFAINSQASPRNFAGQTAMIPEPGSIAMVALGALALGSSIFARRRR